MALQTFDLTGLKKFLNSIDSVKIAALSTTLKEFAFDGFEPTVFMTNLNRIAVLKGRTEDQFKDDIVHMVGIALQRGNINQIALKSMSAAGQARVNELCTIYGITLRANGQAKMTMTKDTINFPRVLACTPWLASLIIKSDTFFAPRSLMGPCGSDDLPDVMKHTGFSALIPRGDAGQVLLRAHVAWMIDLSYVINPNDKSDIKKKYNSQLNFSNSSYLSKMTENKERIKFIQSFDLDNVGKFTKVVAVNNKLADLLGVDAMKIDTAFITKATINVDCINWS